MGFKNYILAALLMVLSIGTSHAQKEKGIPRTKKVPSALDRARSLKSEKPKEAIRIIESVVKSKRKDYDPGRDAEAYMLLGDIYQEIDQKGLALQRYNQAAKILEKTELTELKARNHLAIGLLNLEEINTQKAEQEFNACLKITKDNSTRIQCEIGSADVEFQNGNYDKSISLYDIVQKGHSTRLDSITRSEIAAKKSNVYVKKKDLDRAKRFYFSSLNMFPTWAEDDRVYEPIEKANRILLDNISDVDEKIELRKQNIEHKESRNFPRQSIISEQLELADLFLEKGDIEQAEKYINASKSLTVNTPNTEQTAEVFRKAAEISQQRGSYDEANKNYKEYNLANEQSNRKKQEELERKLDIFKDQAKIDILDQELKIEEKQEELLTQQLNNQKIIIGFLSLLLLGSLVSFYFIMRNVKAKRKANSLLLLKSLRTQMNPHFIFNALNSVNNYIAKNDEKAANKFLANFSKLMRMVLDYSQKDFISFEEEIHLIELYLELEHARFRDKFDYDFNCDEDLNYSVVEIPPMLIQPFIENAIWHGLRYKKGKGLLTVNIAEGEVHLKITITDDGIGREKSKALKTKNQKQYNSTGLKNVDKRIALINDIYAKNYEIEVRDAYPDKEDVGTYVSIKIPIES